MAIFRPGPLLNAISGNLGGCCFVQSKAGPVIRHRPLKINPKTSLQLGRRTAIHAAAAGWHNLPTEIRQGWISAAASLQFTNRLGTTRTQSGWQLWLRFIFDLHPNYHGSAIICPTFVRTPAPVSCTFTVNSGGLWTAALDVIPYGPLAINNFFVSRPVRSTPIRHFSNWFFLSAAQQPPNTMTIYNPVAPDPRISNVVAGEFIGLKVQRRINDPGYWHLFSAPLTSTTFAV